MTVMTFRTDGNHRYSWIKEEAIAVRKPGAPMHHPAQHNHLVSERSIFGIANKNYEMR
jgi:hypothetical protein